jgi:membrane-associated phospholipid phosphatase
MAKSVTRDVAELVSFALNAPVFAFFTFLALLVGEGAAGFWLSVGLTAAFGTVVPLAFIFCLLRGGLITDFYASSRESRAVPFVGALVSYALGTVLLLATHAVPVVTATMLCYFGNSLVMMLITFRWKVCVHASGIAGPATALSCSLGTPWLSTFLLLIPVGWARIRLGAHSLSQVVAGALLTIPLTWVQLQIILNHILR